MTRFVEVQLLPDSDASDGGRYDYLAAMSASLGFDFAATRIEGQTGSRASHASSAGQDFRGHFSQIFEANAATAAGDARVLAQALRQVAGFVRQMTEAAREEDARRRTNNEWVRQHNDRNILEKGWDWFVGEEPRPAMAAGASPTFPPAEAGTGQRQNPAPGSGGSSGGVSSARPSDLRSFVTGSRGLNDSLEGEPGRLERALADFASTCTWGEIKASGLIRGYREYLRANEEDAKWASVLADAFEAAGGDAAVSSVSDAALAHALAAAGVDASRAVLQVDPPTAAGAIPTTGFANDPVNTATGNFIEPETDLSFMGMASLLDFTRMYNSLPSALEDPGVFGPGWASVLDQQLTFSDEGCRWVMADGRAVDFPREGAGHGRCVGENYWLARESAAAEGLAELDSLREGTSELLVIRDNQGAWWAYTLAGVWVGTGAGPGRTVSVHRDRTAEGAGTGQVTRLTQVRGRFLEIDYADGLVAVVRASDRRRVEYGYDSAGRLTSVATELGARTYRWNDQGLIDAVVSAAGVLEAENTYDEHGRVALQVTQHGRRTRFAYLPGRVTVVSDEDGSRSNAWIADSKGRLVGVLDSEDRRQSMAYDAHGNLVSFTERDGSVTVHAYDERGRRIRTVTPEGADLTYGWDEQDRITTLVTASGAVVAYEYADDGSRDPSAMIDPLGGRTELDWRNGLLTRVTDPVGVELGFEYDGFGDLVATRNAVGDVARIARDGAGRPVAAISPSGAQTRFAYDATGALVRRENPDGGVWAFEHDRAGRITASVAPDGGRTELQYAANGELARTVDALGRSVERIFDELGNVTGTVLPDGARRGFVHDDLSRLVGIKDPAGQDWLREYDPVGNLSAVVDPTGVRTDSSTDRKTGTATLSEAFASSTIRFDEYGRPLRVEAEDGSAELISYDAAGNPVELVDGEGGLTVLGRDVAGKITSVTSPTGAVTRFQYDACGRPWRTTDPLGAVTELAYDADQRVTARTLPTGEVERFEYDPCGRLLLHRNPGRGVSRYAYDKAGRLTFSQDAWNGMRRFKYNVAGELTETVNGVGGRTRFEYDVRGRLVRVTDPVGGVVTRTYTDTDQVESVTDPLGRVTTATYDPAGRLLSRTDPDGQTTSWAYDAAGREVSVSVDGQLVSALERDLVRRRLMVTDYSGPDWLAVEHELSFDRRGLLTGRTRGGAGLSWEYDADGNRVRFTDAQGTVTAYTRDAAGQGVAVENSLLGPAVFAHDASGRITCATVGDLVQEWVYRHGYLAEHSRSDRSGAGATDVTLIGRDAEGRITDLTRAGDVTRYGYDGAGQMFTAATTRGGSASAGAVSGWEYDAGGRLVRESTPDGVRLYEYDVAGQLLAVTDPDGTRVEYVYDELGRRSRLIAPDGAWTEYAWGANGSLAGTTVRTPDGGEVSRHNLWVDALGELAGVDGAELWWDTANPVPTLAGIGGGQVLSLPGGVTGFGAGWASAGWRAARPTDQEDPWAVIGAPSLSGVTPGAAGPVGVLPAGVGLTGGGGLEVAGLEWLGARAYDPSVRGFLSTDPLAPVLGAGWDGNPYAYAGNNPLNATDPTGLSPLTDAELKAYDGSSGGAFAAVGDWWKDYGDYVIAGAAIVVGVALIFTGFGGPVGMALIGAVSGSLISGGASIASQKYQNNEVDWSTVGVDALVGGAAGLAGGGAAGIMSKVAPSVGRWGAGAGQSVLRQAFSSTGRAATAAGTAGATSNTLNYQFNNTGEKTFGGYAQSAATGFGAGSLFGVGGTKVSSYFASKLPITPRYPDGWNPRLIAPNIQRWTTGTSESVNHVFGGIQGVTNEHFRPAGNTSRQGYTSAFLQGFALGSKGPAAGVHRAP